jgi:phosphoribosylamine-glycine ligase
VTFHLASAAGDGFCLAYRLSRDGHPVTWSIKERDGRAIGKGLVDQAELRGRDTVVFDAVGMRRNRNASIGGNALETWETDRDQGMAIMEEYGLDIPKTIAFTDLDRALAFLRKHDGEWYFKPDGMHVPKSMTRKGDSGSLLRFLAWAEPHLRKVPRFILQEPIDDGIELDIGAWINGSGPVAYEVCIEEKKFLYDNIGPSTGCQSNVLWDIPYDCPLAKVLDPFIDDLVNSGYVGLVGLNTMWTPKGEPYGLEWTMRLGFDSTQAELMIWSDTLGPDLAVFAQGGWHGFGRSKKAGMTLRLSTPPQPQEDSKDDKKLEGLPLDADLLEHNWFLPDDVALDADGKPVCATGSGFIGTVGVAGNNLDTMRKTLVDRAKGLDIPDLMYRPDPVSRAGAALKYIRAHNLCPDPFS